MPQRGLMLAALLAMSLSACSKDAGSGAGGVSGRIGAEGGILQADGVTLSVPEGALNDPVDITVTVLEVGGAEVPGRVRVSKVFQVSPDTVRFLTPATVTLAYLPELLPGSIPASAADVRHTDFSRTTPERLGSTLVNEVAVTVSGETNGLGTFWATTPEGPRAVSVILAPEESTAYVGGRVTFEAEVRDQNGRLLAAQPIAWSVSNELVATIDSTGEARALAAGSTEIIAKVGAASGKARLLVASADDFAKVFSWENPLPGSADLWAVRGDQHRLAVAGSHGTMAVRAAGAWTRLYSSPLTRFRDVASAGDEVLAVGSRSGQGLLVRYDGEKLSELLVPDTDLGSLWIDGEAGMAVGDGPNLAVRGTAGEWSVEPTPVTEPLLAVSGKEGEAIVVGARGSVYRRVEGIWVALSSAPLPEFQVAAVAHGDLAWAVSARTLRRYAAGAWATVPLPESPALTLKQVGLVGGTVVVSGKDATGKTWVLVDDGSGFRSLAPGSEVNGLGGASTADLYAVGPAGFVARWDGTAWTPLREGASGHVESIAAFAGPTQGQVFAAANQCVDEACATRTGVMLQRDAASGRFATVAEPFDTILHAVAGKAADDLWAMGEGGKAYHLTRGSWVAETIADPAVSCLVPCADALYACGSSGVLSHGAGPSWSGVLPEISAPRGIACWGGGLFVVGDYSTYLVEGGQVHAIDPREDDLYPAPWRTVWATQDGHAFIGGDARYLLHWDGEHFEAMDQPANVPILSTRAIWGTSYGNVWAGGLMRGGASFLIHFNGAFWQPVDAGMDGPLGSISGLANGELWVGGEWGALLHGTLLPRP
ncbi:MAG: Ig-like domain-containing protein [Deltaproteobacteria bacterium]|nr:Ig-like domain-containing protein [Deltaproteobacteria bacterium]